jgi:predicted DNA-binding transcriptional regulator AlpA
LDEKTRALAISLYNNQINMVKDICATLGISRSTLYRYVDQVAE